ncbi:hypothetical protein APPUASWS_000385 [Arthrospira platensis str. Paraca]|nr:hypothetical protein APPUASWS_000385 [Arthrospira platensis str. Paraca]
MKCDRFLVNTQNFLNSQTTVDICGYEVRSLFGKYPEFPQLPTNSRYLLVMECDRFLVNTQNFLNSQPTVDISWL